MNRQPRDIKHTLFKITSVIFMLSGFLAGIIISIFPLLPLFKKLGPDPNRFVVIFVVLPVMVIIGAIFGYVGIFLAMLLWKPFLSNQEAKKFVFEPRTPDEEIPRAVNLIFVKPYYKLAKLVYPDAEKDEQCYKPANHEF